MSRCRLWRSGGSHGHMPLASTSNRRHTVVGSYTCTQSLKVSSRRFRVLCADSVPPRLGRVLARFRANSLSESVPDYFSAVSSDTPPAFPVSPVSSVCVWCQVSSAKCPLPLFLMRLLLWHFRLYPPVLHFCIRCLGVVRFDEDRAPSTKKMLRQPRKRWMGRVVSLAFLGQEHAY
jgi:hypothetical protein